MTDALFKEYGTWDAREKGIGLGLFWDTTQSPDKTRWFGLQLDWWDTAEECFVYFPLACKESLRAMAPAVCAFLKDGTLPEGHEIIKDMDWIAPNGTPAKAYNDTEQDGGLVFFPDAVGICHGPDGFSHGIEYVVTKTNLHVFEEFVKDGLEFLDNGTPPNEASSEESDL